MKANPLSDDGRLLLLTYLSGNHPFLASESVSLFLFEPQLHLRELAGIGKRKDRVVCR